MAPENKIGLSFGGVMTKQIDFWTELERDGVANVRGKLDAGKYSNQDKSEMYARQWLAKKELEERDEQMRLNTRAVSAAEWSAKWAFWAAIVALLTVLVSVLPGFLAWLFR
jgi:hypothetical protein